MLFINFICFLYLMVLVTSHTISRSYARTELTDYNYDSFNGIHFRHKPRNGRIPVRHERGFRRKKQKSADTKVTKQMEKVNAPTKETVQFKVAIDNPDKTQKAVTSTESLKQLGNTYVSKFRNAVNGTHIYKKLSKWKRPHKKKEKTKKQKAKTKNKKSKNTQSNLERPPIKNKRSLQKMNATTKAHTTSQNRANYNKEITQIISEMSTKLDELRRLYVPGYAAESTGAKNVKLDEDLSKEGTDLEGTAAIEELLSQVKFRTIGMIAKNTPSITESITNAVTETTYTIDPLLNHLQYITPLFSLSTLITMNGDAMRAQTEKPLNRRTLDSDENFSYFLFQMEPNRKERSALANTTGRFLNLAQDVEGNVEGKLKSLLNKFKSKTKDKTTKKITPTTKATKKLTVVSNSTVGVKRLDFPKNVTEIPSSDATTSKSFGTTAKHKKGRHVTSTEASPTTDSDYGMLALYEYMLGKAQEKNLQKFLSTKSSPTLKRNARKVTTVVMQTKPDEENENTEIEVSTQVPIEDTTYEGLSKKLAYSEFVNGFKHYLDFERDMGHTNYSYLVRYQAHRHHDVDDIGKYILDKIPPIPKTVQEREKRGFDDNYDDDQDVSTKSEDSWFKRHFYYFVDKSSPKKFHTSQTVPLKDVTSQMVSKAKETSSTKVGSYQRREDHENKWKSTEMEKDESEFDLDELSALLKQRAGNTAMGFTMEEESSTKSLDSDSSQSPRLFHKFQKYIARPVKKPAPKKHSKAPAEKSKTKPEEARVRRQNDVERQEANKYDLDYNTKLETLKTVPPTPVKKPDKKKLSYANVIIKPVKQVKKKGKIRKFFEKFKIKKKKCDHAKDKRPKRDVQRHPRFNILDSLKNIFNNNDKPELINKDDEDYEIATKRLKAFKPIRYDKPYSLDDLYDVPEVMENTENIHKNLDLQANVMSEAPSVPEFSKWDPDKYEFEKAIDEILKEAPSKIMETKFSTNSSYFKEAKTASKIDDIMREIDNIDMRITTDNPGYHNVHTKTTKKKEPQTTTVGIQIDSDLFDIGSDANATLSTLAKQPVSNINDNFDIDTQIESSKVNVDNNLNNKKTNKKDNRFRNANYVNFNVAKISPIYNSDSRVTKTIGDKDLTKKTYQDYDDTLIWNSDILQSASTWRNILHNAGVNIPELETTTEGRSIQNQLDEFMDKKLEFMVKTNKNDHDQWKNKYSYEADKILGEERKYKLNEANLKRHLDVNATKNVNDIVGRLNSLIGRIPQQQEPKDITRSSIKPSSGKGRAHSQTKLTTPRQRYSTPLPMEPLEFETFLKKNDLDVQSLTQRLPLDTSEIGEKLPEKDKAKFTFKNKDSDQIAPMQLNAMTTLKTKVRELNNEKTNVQNLQKLKNKAKAATPYSKRAPGHRTPNDKKVEQKRKTKQDKVEVTLIDFENEFSVVPNLEMSYYDNMPLHKDIIENMKLAKVLSPETSDFKDTMFRNMENSETTPTYTKEIWKLSTSPHKHNKLLYFNKALQNKQKASKNVENKSKIQKESHGWTDGMENPSKFKNHDMTMYLKFGNVRDENFKILKYLPKHEKLPKRIRINGQSYKYDIEYRDIEDKLHHNEEKIFKESVSKIAHLLTPPAQDKQFTAQTSRGFFDRLMNSSEMFSTSTKQMKSKKEKTQRKSYGFNFYSKKVPTTPIDATRRMGATRFFFSKLMGRTQSSTKSKEPSNYELNIGFKDCEVPMSPARKWKRDEKVSKIKRRAESSTAKSVNLRNDKNLVKEDTTSSLLENDGTTDKNSVPNNAKTQGIIQEESSKRPLKRSYKFFSAKLLNPTDFKYQIHPGTLEETTTTKLPVSVYLLVKNQDEMGGNFVIKPLERHELNPVVRQADVAKEHDHTEKVTTTPNKLNKVTLSKDFILAINEIIDSKLSNYTGHKIRSREASGKNSETNAYLAKTKGKTTATSTTASMKSMMKDKTEPMNPYSHDFYSKKTTKTGPTLWKKLRKIFHANTTAAKVNVVQTHATETTTLDYGSLGRPSTLSVYKLKQRFHSSRTPEDTHSSSPKDQNGSSRTPEYSVYEVSLTSRPKDPKGITHNFVNKLMGRSQSTAKSKNNITLSGSQNHQTNVGFQDYEEQMPPLTERKPKRQAPKNSKGQETFTAQNVDSLEVVVDLVKATTYVPRGICEDRPSAKNSVQVHIALPNYPQTGIKRSVDRYQTVFSAKFLTPTDVEYQIHSRPLNEEVTTSAYLPPGMYLLVANQDEGAKGNDFILTPIDDHVGFPKLARQMFKEYQTTENIATDNKFNKVTLNKDFVEAVNEKIKELYAKGNSIHTEHKVHTREVYSEKERAEKRCINWSNVKKFFGNERACNCKCKVNKTMCRACAASDAVMGELIFEINNLVKYMSDHCTEIQTFFLMNPTGGKKLRDAVKKLDRSLQNYYKRVKGKCNGKTCDAFRFIDKREFVQYSTVPTKYIGNQLADDIANIAYDIDKAAEQRICINDKLKEGSYKLIKVVSNCANGNVKNLRPETKNNPVKNVYSLDNVHVNIICNTESTSANGVLDLDNFQTTDNTFDYDEYEPTTPMKGTWFKKFLFRHAPFVSHFRKSRHGLRKKDLKREIRNDNPLNADSGGSFWEDFINKERTKKTTVGKSHKTKLETPAINIMSLGTTDKTNFGNNTETMLFTDTAKSYSQTESRSSEIGPYQWTYTMNDVFKLLNNDFTESTTDNIINSITEPKTRDTKTCCKCCKGKKKSKCKCKCKCAKNNTNKVETKTPIEVTVKSSKTAKNKKVKTKIPIKNKTITPSTCSSKVRKTKTNTTTTKMTSQNATTPLQASNDLKNKINKWKNASMGFIKKKPHLKNKSAQKIPTVDAKISNFSISDTIVSSDSDIFYTTVDPTDSVYTSTNDNPTIIILNDYNDIFGNDLAAKQTTPHNDIKPGFETSKVKKDKSVDNNSYKDLLVTLLKYEGQRLQKELRRALNGNNNDSITEAVEPDIINLRIKIINDTRPSSTQSDYGFLNALQRIYASSSTTESVVSRLLSRLSLKKHCGNKVAQGPVVRSPSEPILQSSTEESGVGDIDLDDPLNADVMLGDDMSTTPPTSDLRLCDLQDTFAHTLTALEQMNEEYFQSYISNLTCHRYRRAPKYFYIRPEGNKDDNLKWNWIRSKRSTFCDGFKETTDDIEKDSNENDDSNAHSVLEDIASNNGFEKLYRDENGIYRSDMRRKKRTISDVQALSRELRNLPPIVVPKNQIYAMAGDSLTLTCPLDPFTDGPYSWWMESGMQDNVEVDGRRLVIRRTGAENVGAYTCSKGGRQLNSTRVRVIALPQFRVMFSPVYRSSRQCNNIDLHTIRQLGKLMTEAACPGRSCVVKISHPSCSRDEADEHSLLSLTAALVPTSREIRCGVRCRRDIQCGLAAVAAQIAPVLASIPVIIASEDGNVTLSPTQRRAGLHSALRSADWSVPPVGWPTPGDVDVVLVCPAGYFLVSADKICVATPPAQELIGDRRQRRYEFDWWRPPWLVLGACVGGGAVCAHVGAIVMRGACAARGGRRRVTAAAPVSPPRRKISPSRVILPRLFRNASSRISQDTKLDFVVKRPPPLPPIDFDS